jgi:hypothetical protein
MVELAIEDRVIPKEMFNEKSVSNFVEKQLLPAINAQPADRAHNMSYALQAIIEVSQMEDTPRLPCCTLLCVMCVEPVFRVQCENTACDHHGH